MQSLWLIVLVISVCLLFFVLLKSRLSLKWFGYALTSILISAVFLYFINVIGVLGDLYIPINAATALTIGILGVPGLGLLIALKMVVI